MAWADKSPQEASNHERANRVAGPNVNGSRIVLGQVCDQERQQERPMGHADKRISDPDLGISLRGHLIYLPVFPQLGRAIPLLP